MPDPTLSVDTPELQARQPLQLGTPEYQSAEVETFARSQQPQWEKALGQLEQNLVSRGAPTGVAMEAMQDFERDKIRGVEDFAGKAALEAAKVGEENRRKREEREWQIKDRDVAWDRALKMMEHQEAIAENQEKMGLVGSLVRSGARLGGGFLGGLGGGEETPSRLEAPEINFTAPTVEYRSPFLPQGLGGQENFGLNLGVDYGLR